MTLILGAYGKSWANTVGPFGGCAFGAVSTPAPPDPHGWTKANDASKASLKKQVIWQTGVSAVTNRPGWVKQMGIAKSLSRVEQGVTEWIWVLVYMTTDGVSEAWYMKWAHNQPPYPAVPALPGEPDAYKGETGEGTTSITTGSGTKGDPKVAALQKALNLAGAKGKDGKELVVDGNAGPNTCWACYQFQKEIGSLKEQPTLSEEFFGYLGLPASYAVALGGLCVKYYTGPYYEPMPSQPTTPAQPAQPAQPSAPVIPEPTAPPPELVEVQQAGFPWWAGALAGVALIGGALWWKKKKKKKGGGKGKKSSRRR